MTCWCGESGCGCKRYADQTAEIERLRVQCGGNCRYWEGRYHDEAAVNKEAAAFLDGLAERLEDWPFAMQRGAATDCAADCRAMAEKLRGET